MAESRIYNQVGWKFTKLVWKNWLKKTVVNIVLHSFFFFSVFYLILFLKEKKTVGVNNNVYVCVRENECELNTATTKVLMTMAMMLVLFLMLEQVTHTRSLRVLVLKFLNIGI
jgi:ribonucleotide reductase beta subunit family protein with ferritin-like domain